VLIALSVLALVADHGTAGVFKCTNPDGSVTYSQTKCADSEDESQVELTPDLADRSNGIWGSELQVDELIGKRYCLLFSRYGSAFANTTARGMELTPIYIRVSENKTVYVISGTEGLFAHEIAGLGLRVDDNPFVPIDVRADKHTLAFGSRNSSMLIAQMKDGKSLRGRVAFFPYAEQTRDFELSLSGFPTALAQFKQCLEALGVGE
jgi:hypothetical protein